MVVTDQIGFGDKRSTDLRIDVNLRSTCSDRG